ncbi:hypothetical protein [Thermogemmatispora sp.]|uniref:hypothetical protein n=1 Tax=Thermogemmatispora sp. TaxID=1968838 RepID=UPI0035E45331
MARRALFRGSLPGLPGRLPENNAGVRSSGSFAPLTDLVGGDPLALQADQWSADTSLALSLTERYVGVLAGGTVRKGETLWLALAIRCMWAAAR